LEPHGKNNDLPRCALQLNVYNVLNCTNLNGMAFVHLEIIFYGMTV
jgi:hypothetical protein